MKRGYVRQIRGNAKEAQRAALEQAGVSPIYDDASPVDAIEALRLDDELCIAGSLRVLADTRDQLATAMSMIYERGACVRDVLTGRVASDSGATMAIEALAEMARERVRHVDHRGAAYKRWGKTTQPTPKKQALKAWRDVVKYPMMIDALASEDMAGWTRSIAYRELGRRSPPYT